VEFIAKGDEIDGLLGLAQRDHLIENIAMLQQEKIVDLQCFDRGVEGVVVEQNGAEDGTFRIKVAGQGPFESGVSRHGKTGNELRLFRLFFA